jgi:hypothetical protein
VSDLANVAGVRRCVSADLSPAVRAGVLFPRMVSNFYNERHRHWICRGRLALALVGQRVERCPNPQCARARHCTAFSGNKRDPVTRDWLSDCPIMTAAEYDATRLGGGYVGEGLRPWFLAEDQWLAGLINEVPKAKRAEVKAALQAVKERNAAARPKWKPYYWDILWTEPVDHQLVTSTNIVADERKLVALARAKGCRCAKEGMTMDCRTCEAWMSEATEAPTPAARA